MNAGERFATFPSTSWSEVLAAGRGAAAPLERLTQRYWPAVYSYLRNSGRDSEVARDLTQGFFVSLLEHEFFARARAEYGRFRTYLLGALRNFLINEHDRATALKRGGGTVILLPNFDLVEARLASERDLDPVGAFDRQWALQTLTDAIARLRGELAPAALAAFEASMADPTRPYRAIGRELGISEDRVSNHIYRARRRLRAILLEHLRDSVADADQLNEEVVELCRAFEAWRP